MATEIQLQRQTVTLANDDAANESAIESLVLHGDITKMSSRERAVYYVRLCGSLRLNPATQPIKFIAFQGRTIPYFTRDATDQLAAINRLNRKIIAGPEVRDFCGHKLLYAQCEGSLPNGRVETASALVPIPSGGGEALANAVMKTETKSRRRVTLAILGLGFIDESELDTMPGAVRLDTNTLLASEPTPTDAAAAHSAVAALEDGVRADVAREPWVVAVLDDIASARMPPDDRITVEIAAVIYLDRRPEHPDPADKDAAWRALLAACPAGTSSAALTRACKAEQKRREPPPDGPRGGGAPRPAANDGGADAAEVAAIEAANAGAPSARSLDAYAAYLSTKASVTDVENAFAANVHDYDADEHAQMRVAVARLRALAPDMSENVAVNRLRIAANNRAKRTRKAA